jgi:tRNA-dihydrouridine synthase B
MHIGDLTIHKPVFLAPMSGVSDQPFRRLVRRYGGDLVYSEMIASGEMVRAHKETLQMSTGCADEYPMAVQLAGCSPEIMAEAAKMNVDRGAALIDINMGCPVKKIVKSYAGSALMRDETLACQIMAAVVRAVNVPVTLKMRLGWDEHNLNAVSLAKKAEDIGIQAITVHGRTRMQMYTGQADWTKIRAVSDAVSVPVIGNGDIGSVADAQACIEIAGVKGVMIGRATYGRPWLIGQIAAALAGQPVAAAPSGEALSALILEHYDMMCATYGEYRGVRQFRKHLSWYVQGMHGANIFRDTINQLTDPQAVKHAIEIFFKKPEHDHHNNKNERSAA